MNRLTYAWLAMTVGSSIVYAQDALIGSYSGSYTPAGGGKPRGVELTIASEEGGEIKGTIRLNYPTRGSGSRNPCTGDYPMSGKAQDGKLVMRSTEKSGTTDDCSFSFNAVKEGNKLVGTTGTRGTGSPLTLSK